MLTKSGCKVIGIRKLEFCGQLTVHFEKSLSQIFEQIRQKGCILNTQFVKIKEKRKSILKFCIKNKPKNSKLF